MSKNSIVEEVERLKRLMFYQIVDTENEQLFDDITKLVSETLDVPIVLISLVTEKRQWFKSAVGLDVTETDRSYAFCEHTIRGNHVFEVVDATKDKRFKDNPLVLGDPHIRFYAGAPLRDPEGYNLGSLCIIDRKPRTCTENEKKLISKMSNVVMDLISMRQENIELVKLLKKKNEIISSLSHELRTPLTAIRGFNEILLNTPVSQEQKRLLKIYVRFLR